MTFCCCGVCAVDNAGCVSIIRDLWLTPVTWFQPIVHATDIMHALGNALTPVIALPFVVSSTPQDSAAVQKWNITPAEWKEADFYSHHCHSTEQLVVRSVYALVGVFDIVVAFICLAASSSLCLVDVVPLESTRVCDERRNHASVSPTASLATRGSDELAVQPPRAAAESSRNTVVLLVVVALFFALNGGRDALLNTLLFTYVDEYLGWNVASSAALVTTYHVVRALVHGVLAALQSRCCVLTPRSLMMFNVLTLVVSSALMLTAVLLVHAVGDVLTWLGVVVSALATSNIHQTTIGLVHRHFIAPPVVMVGFVAALGVGQIVMAPLCGYLLQSAGVASFPAMLLALALAGLALYVLCLSHRVFQ